MNQQSAKREHNAMRFNRKYFEFAAMPVSLHLYRVFNMTQQRN